MATALKPGDRSFFAALGSITEEYQRVLARCIVVESELRALQPAADGPGTFGHVAAEGPFSMEALTAVVPADFASTTHLEKSCTEVAGLKHGVWQASQPLSPVCAAVAAGQGTAFSIVASPGRSEAASDTSQLGGSSQDTRRTGQRSRSKDGQRKSLGSRPSMNSDLDLAEIRQILDSDEHFRIRRHAGNRVWIFLTEPDSSVKARFYQDFMNPFFVASLCLTMTQHIPGLMLHGFGAGALEIAFEVFFATDITIRFLASPSKRSFCRNAYNIIDVLSALPIPVRLAGWRHVYATERDVTVYSLVLLGFVPVLRLLKLLRRFEKFHLVFAAFKVAFEALPVLLYTFCVMWCAFSSLLFTFEPLSFFEALWLTVVTMTTVGYGDMTPETPVGHVVLTALMLCSALYMAVPLGIVGNAFNRVWQDRSRLLLMSRTRDKLSQWGYSPVDIPKLFVIFGRQHPGELKYSEFRRMFQEMRVGMKEVDIYELFQSFDEDGSGSIDHEEFVKGLYPQEFVEGKVQRGSTSDEPAWSEEMCSRLVSPESVEKVFPAEEAFPRLVSPTGANALEMCSRVVTPEECVGVGDRQQLHQTKWAANEDRAVPEICRTEVHPTFNVPSDAWCLDENGIAQQAHPTFDVSTSSVAAISRGQVLL